MVSFEVFDFNKFTTTFANTDAGVFDLVAVHLGKDVVFGRDHVGVYSFKQLAKLLEFAFFVTRSH